MKNKFIVLTIALLGLVSSCSDAYDIVQDGERNHSEQVYKDANDVESGINAIYESIPAETEVEFASTFTDEISLGISNGGQGLISGEYGFRMDPGNAYAAAIWNGYYALINRVNRLEVIAKKLQSEDVAANKTKYDDSLAELYVLRAYAHYKLFSYFTPDYTNPNGLSVINLDHVPPLDYKYSLGRNTVAEVVKFIEDDLKLATDLRNAGWRDSDYVNADVMNAIRVKLYAMTGNWDGVLEYGQLVLGKIHLAKPDDYLKIFPRDLTLAADIETPSTELVFQLKRTANNGGSVAAAWYSGNVSKNGSPFYQMGRSLYNELDALDPSLEGEVFKSRNDVRYEVNLDDESEVQTNYESLSQGDYASDILLIGKYQGINASGAVLRNSIPLIRSTDILLAMAEARAARGELPASSTDPDDLVDDYSSVYSILYTVRFYRSNDFSKIVMPTINNQKDAFNAILKERRVEFAFEGQRYLDMKRLGVKAGSEGFTRYSKDCFRNGACNLPVDDHRMTLPIPVTEMNGNVIVRSEGQQNPGY